MAKFQFVLLIHAHQPVGNFDDVIERAYVQSYLPFVQVLARHPSIRMGLHFTGSLLEWIERVHPEYFDLLRTLVQRGQVELAGGGFYEPILIAIPPEDRHEQITRLADYIEQHFGVRPRGAWLAERVWEPQLPSSLAPSGVEYTLVDDNHFLGAGFELDQLYGYYLAEDQGHSVKVLPGLKALRYLLPFHAPADTIEFLRASAKEHPGGFAAMGDDLEKFGVWPGTNKLCYTDGWLENLFVALEQNSDWLETATPTGAVVSHPALGRADLPTASYSEMMEWALPTPARNRYHALTTEFAARTEMLPFLRGGIWRNFFSKYGESNLLHKKMLHVSQKVRKLYEHPRPVQAFRDAREQARTLTLRGQCNDPYWHGVFGGLYSPHLRTALWRGLIQAEAIADALSNPTGHYQSVATMDFDSDGRDEIYFTSRSLRGGAMSRGRRHDFRARLPPVQCRAGEFAGAPPGVLPREAQEFESRRSPWRAIHSRTNARERNRPGSLAQLRPLGAPLFPLAAFQPREETSGLRHRATGGRPGTGRRNLSRRESFSYAGDSAVGSQRGLVGRKNLFVRE